MVAQISNANITIFFSNKKLRPIILQKKWQKNEKKDAVSWLVVPYCNRRDYCVGGSVVIYYICEVWVRVFFGAR